MLHKILCKFGKHEMVSVDKRHPFPDGWWYKTLECKHCGFLEPRKVYVNASRF
jgi:hypothetical protein